MDSDKHHHHPHFDSHKKHTDELPAIQNNPYKYMDAQVRCDSGISQGEKDYLKKRLPIAKATLETVLNCTLEDHQIPIIAMPFSGGGYRAMLCATGSLNGTQKIKILDAITYVTSLSGSTWAIGPWISTQLPLEKFSAYIKDCASKPFLCPTEHEEALIWDAAAVKSHYHQPKTPVDLYGDLLGNRLLEHFGDQRHIIYLSSQALAIGDGAYPYPIYTAIDADENIIKNQTWYEFTPDEIGNPVDQVYIPTWAFGRKFKQGLSHKGKFDTYPPEKNLAYNMGMYGSAFGANIKTIEKEIAKRMGHWEYIEELLKPIRGERPLDFYGKVANYARKLSSEHKGTKYATFVDAGTDFNLPVSPVSGLCPERKADIFIICDASAGHIGHELKKAVHYMEKHKLPFPQIDFEHIDKKTISIFKGKDPNTPTVIYLPRISDQELLQKNLSNPEFTQYQNLLDFDIDEETKNGFAQTIHFQYDPENAQKVMDQMEFNIRVSQAQILETIKWVIDRKKPLSI